MKQRSQALAQVLALPTATASPGVESAASGKALHTLTTLDEQGPNLPVGMVIDGKRSRLFRLRPFKLKQEKALSKLKDAKGIGAGEFVRDALSLMVQTIGPHSFDGMKDGERQLMINSLSMPDVLYLYMYLRHEAMGQEPVRMNIMCRNPKCGIQFEWYGDLGSMDVKVVPDDCLDTSRWYELRDGIALRGERRTKLKLDLIKWDMFCRAEFSKDGVAQMMAVVGSVVGYDGFKDPTLILGVDDLDDMTRFDSAGIIADIEVHTPGPQLDIVPECPNCKAVSRMMLDWSWDNFFSRSAPGTHTPT